MFCAVNVIKPVVRVDLSYKDYFHPLRPTLTGDSTICGKALSQMALNVMMTSARVEETPVKMEVLFRNSHPQTITLQCSFVERQAISLELKSPPRLVVKTRATLRYKSGNIQSRDTFRPIVRSH